MRKLSIVFLFLLSFFSASAQTWTPVISGTNRNLHSVTMADNQTVYAISSSFYGDSDWGMGSDILLRSFDNGNSWDSAYVNGFGMDIFFLNDSVGFLSGGMPSCGIAATVMKTADKGVNWDAWSASSVWSVPMSVAMGYSASYFWSPDSGYVFGGAWGAEQYKTLDNGANWMSAASFKSQDSYPSVFFLNPMEGYLVSDSVTTFMDSLGNITGKSTTGYIYKTTDGGANWNVQSFPNDSLSDVHFPGQNTGYVAAGTKLLKTTTAGTVWTTISLPFSAVKLGFMTDTKGYIVAKDGNLYKTTDGGNTWALDYTGNFLGIEVNREKGFAVGKNGSIIRLESLTSDIPQDNLSRPFRVFPNPSSDFIQVICNQAGEFSVELYNAAGQLLKQDKSSQSLMLNLQQFPAQTFYLQIKDERGELLQTEKIIKQ